MKYTKDMKTIEAQVQVDMNRMLTIQLPADVQAGEYDVVLMNTASNHTTTIAIYERRHQ